MGTDGACGLLFGAAKRSGAFPSNSEPSVCMAMMWPCIGWGGRGLWRMRVGTMLIMACMASSSRSRAAVLSVVDADIPGEMALAVVVPIIGLAYGLVCGDYFMR